MAPNGGGDWNFLAHTLGSHQLLVSLEIPILSLTTGHPWQQGAAKLRSVRQAAEGGHGQGEEGGGPAGRQVPPRAQQASQQAEDDDAQGAGGDWKGAGQNWNFQ